MSKEELDIIACKAEHIAGGENGFPLQYIKHTNFESAILVQVQRINLL